MPAAAVWAQARKPASAFRSTLPPLSTIPTRLPLQSRTPLQDRRGGEAAGRLDDDFHAFGEEAKRIDQLRVRYGDDALDRGF